NGRALVTQYKQGISESRRVYLTALKVAELLGNDQLVAQTWYQLGSLHSSYDLGKAIEYYSHSYDKFLQIGYLSDLIYVCAELASSYNRKRELAKAKVYADEAIKYKALVQSDTPSTKRWPPEYGLAWAFVAKAYIAYQEGETINAIRYGKQAISIYHELARQKVFVKYGSAAALSIIENCYMRSAEYREAKRYYNQALKTARQTMQQDRVASSLVDLGTLFLNQEEHEDALNYYEQARLIFEK